MLCRAYELDFEGESWYQLSRSAMDQAFRHGWLSSTVFMADDVQMCRGALYSSALTAANVPIYDSVLYEDGEVLSRYENYLRIGCELQLCEHDAEVLEIVTRGEAVQLLYAILTRELSVTEPSAPVTLENPMRININDFLLELRCVPEPIIERFNALGWKYCVDFDRIAEYSKMLNMNCSGVTDYTEKIICVSKAGSTVHEFGHFLDQILNESAECERLYQEEAAGSALGDYAKTNSQEYFAECFAYWIKYGDNAWRMEVLRETSPQTYSYFQALADRNWGI